MDRQLDAKGSLLLKEAVIKAGVNLSTGIEPLAIEGKGSVTGAVSYTHLSA